MEWETQDFQLAAAVAAIGGIVDEGNVDVDVDDEFDTGGGGGGVEP